jgi:hypothetical protein
MKSNSRFALINSATVALLFGCGGSQPPIDAAGAGAPNRSVPRQHGREESWMLPEAKSAKRLLYLSPERKSSSTTIRRLRKSVC